LVILLLLDNHLRMLRMFTVAMATTTG